MIESTCQQKIGDQNLRKNNLNTKWPIKPNSFDLRQPAKTPSQGHRQPVTLDFVSCAIAVRAQAAQAGIHFGRVEDWDGNSNLFPVAKRREGDGEGEGGGGGGEEGADDLWALRRRYACPK